MSNAIDRSREDARKACFFWAGLEYMNLPRVPELDEDRRVYEVTSDSHFPWRHEGRSARLRADSAHVAYCGLFDKRDFTEYLRDVLGQTPLGANDLRREGNSAVVFIPLDRTGRVSGKLFISSLPWFMSRLPKSRQDEVAAGDVDFTGFKAFEVKLVDKVNQKMREMQLILPEQQDEKTVRPVSSIQPRDAAAAAATPVVPRAAAASSDQVETTRPLTLEDVSVILDMVWQESGWRPNWGPYKPQAGQPQGQGHLVRVKIDELEKDKSVLDLEAMNSFVASDVIQVFRQLGERGGAGIALEQYLKLREIPSRVDVRGGGRDKFIDALSPDGLPLGAWPDFALVSAQQFAVNMSRELLANGGLYGVNGPPGTGKSTLLRDVVADCVVQRALKLAAFDRPEDAFVPKQEIEGYRWGYSRIDDSLRGHGVVVASSNNGAVENVINDLPKNTEHMKRAGMTYFQEVSDSIATPKGRDNERVPREVGKTWGMVAALLGSSSRRNSFSGRFWFEKNPLQSDNPNKQVPLDPLRLRSLPGLMKRGDHGAKPWGVARQAFEGAVADVRQRAGLLSGYISNTRRIGQLEERLTRAESGRAESRAEYEACRQNAQRLRTAAEHAGQRRAAMRDLQRELDKKLAVAGTLRAAQEKVPVGGSTDAQRRVDRSLGVKTAADLSAGQVLALKPGFLELLFSWRVAQEWRKEMKEANKVQSSAHKNYREAEDALIDAKDAEQEVAKARGVLAHVDASVTQLERSALALGIQQSDTLQQIESDAANSTQAANAARIVEDGARSQYESLERQSKEWAVELSLQCSALEAVKKELGPLDPQFLATSYLHAMDDEQLQLAVAYNDPVLRDMRIKVFKLAMELHQSFVVAAWAPLSKSLSAFVNLLSKSISVTQAGDAVPHLWDAFFLVVPVVSTTFASLSDVFDGMEKETLGLLLIDEAGQSTPQNALGGIWRARRVIAVGDPLQLEPVVSQPVEAVAAWRGWTAASKVWEPPQCSAQVLADAVTQFGTELDFGDEKVWVGSPLRVHRRCLNPMFSVSNSIAYQNMMVHGVAPDANPNGWLGPSRWIDIAGEASGHWVESQAYEAIELLQELCNQLPGGLRDSKTKQFHVNVITPYKDISVQFKSLLMRTYPRQGAENLAGTVHTFQGKEADVVIMLLGCDTESGGSIGTYAGNPLRPNLLNVALTRAKKRIYIIGDRELWTSKSPLFSQLSQALG